VLPLRPARRLCVTEVDGQEAGEPDVLVRVATTTVNRTDRGSRAAKPPGWRRVPRR